MKVMRSLFLFSVLVALVAGLKTPESLEKSSVFRFAKVHEHAYDEHGMALYPGRTKLIKAEMKMEQELLRIRKPTPKAATEKPPG